MLIFVQLLYLQTSSLGMEMRNIPHYPNCVNSFRLIITSCSRLSTVNRQEVGMLLTCYIILCFWN